MLTDAQRQQLMPRLVAAKSPLYLPHLNRAMRVYGVNTLQSTAAFIAQLAHETGGFRWMELAFATAGPYGQRRNQRPGGPAGLPRARLAGSGRPQAGRQGQPASRLNDGANASRKLHAVYCTFGHGLRAGKALGAGLADSICVQPGLDPLQQGV